MIIIIIIMIIIIIIIMDYNYMDYKLQTDMWKFYIINVWCISNFEKWPKFRPFFENRK